MGFDYSRSVSGIVVVTMDMADQSANTMSPSYHDLMGKTVARLEAEQDLRGVIFASAKKTFFAGGDLHGLMRAETGDDAYKAWLNEDKGFLRRLERLPVPVVAAINGAALGGGFEICLACNHRIIVDDRAAIVGLPEVTLGLLPGAGGVARLPRLVALDAALDLLLSGRLVAPTEARDLGIVDQIVTSRDDLIPAAIAWIESEHATPEQPWDRAEAELDLDAARALIASARAEVQVRTRGKLPGPVKILDIVEQGVALDLDQTLALETEHFASLLGLPETRAAIWLNFFAANAIRSGKMRPEGVPTTTQNLALLGQSAGAEALAKSATRRVETRRITAADQGSADLTLVFADAVAKAICEIGVVGLELSDTLSSSPARFANAANVFGFRLPAVLANSPIVEIVAGSGTSNETLRKAYDLFQRIGRTPILVQDKRSTFVARLDAAYRSEATKLASEGLKPTEIARIAHDAGCLAPLSDILVNAERVAPYSPDLLRDAEDRLLYIQSIEALQALQEGVLRTEAEADIASVHGVGFPPHTGGAIRFVKGIGIDAFAARAARLADSYGERFAIGAALLDLLRHPQTQAA